MAEVIKGKPVIWGIATAVTPTGITASYYITSVDFAKESEMSEIKNATGQTVGAVFFNQSETLTIECIPTGASLAAAKASQELPIPGDVISVTDTADATLDIGAVGASQIQGDGNNSSYKYLFVRGSKKKAANDMVKLTMELKRWTENDAASTVS